MESEDPDDAQDDLNLCILRMLECILLLDAAHLIDGNKMPWVSRLRVSKSIVKGTKIMLTYKSFYIYYSKEASHDECNHGGLLFN